MSAGAFCRFWHLCEAVADDGARFVIALCLSIDFDVFVPVAISLILKRIHFYRDFFPIEQNFADGTVAEFGNFV